MIFINRHSKQLILSYKGVSVYLETTETIDQTSKQKAEKDLKKYQDQKKDLLDIFHKIEHSFEISDVWIGCSLCVLYNKEERRIISRKYFEGLQKKFRKRKGFYLYI
jgi:hypothetical protein